MCCLIALPFFSLAVIIEKHRRFRLAMRQSQMFKPVFKNFLRGGEAQELIRSTINRTWHKLSRRAYSSHMNAPDLAAQVVDRVKTINFGPKDGVQAVTITYPIDFLSAA